MEAGAVCAGAKTLETHGLANLAGIHWNLSVPALYEAAIRRGEGALVQGGALAVNTGRHTGRAPDDKFIVDSPSVHDRIDWGRVNKPVSADLFERMHQRVAAYFQGREAYVTDAWAGADAGYRLPIRVVTETAWHALFAQTMFIRPARAAIGAEAGAGAPAFTILHAPGLHARGADDGLHSDAFILVDFDRRLVLIGGTSYAGEIKKSVFGILNYLLPGRGVLPMHCSANVGPGGDVAIFFGLSGTGKTTLSADGARTLIGDDEHGWSDRGVFNLEGGCYAKVINLSQTAEPEIFAATRRFGTVLENVAFDRHDRVLDLNDGGFTENTRACYPLDFIPGADPGGTAGHPASIVMLTADAFGVLPPIARLTPEQAMYHFLSGYTARLAGTEKGLGSTPLATFSACFGAPFMPRHPSVYGELLRQRIQRHGAACWLVNTGWTGGRAGDGGARMPIAHTRALVRAALDGRLDGAPVRTDPDFGLLVPQACPGVPGEALEPRRAWADKPGYDRTAAELRGRFADNFRRFDGFVGDAVKAAGIRAAA